MEPERSLWIKYLEGKASLEELKALETWLKATSPDDWAVFIKRQGIADGPMPADMAEHLRRRLQTIATQQRPREATVIPVVARKKRLSYFRWVAAASVILVLSGVFVFRPFRHPDVAAATMTWDSIPNLSSSPKLVTLPDSTKIWLNQYAVLYVNKHYTDQRLVRLKGEGYFEVAKDELHPFVAATGDIQTLVLGTAFNIDNSTGRAAVSISLVRGSVKVRQAHDTASVLLSPGESAMADYSRKTILRSTTGVPDIAGWINGDLIFNQLPLAEALAKFGLYYGLSIRTDPALLQDKLATAVYHRKESWQQTLRHFLFIYQLTYKTDRQKNIYIIPAR